MKNNITDKRKWIKQNMLKALKNIEIKSDKLVNSLISGAYRSIFLGNGIDFSELRHYVIGDDIRFIDWKASARSNEIYIKQFQEEREAIFHFIFDYTKSMFFGKKLEFAILLLGSLMKYAISLNNTIYLTTFSNKIKYFGAFRTLNDIYYLIGTIIDDILENYEKILNENEVELKDVLKASMINRYTHTIIISDFVFDNFKRELMNYKNRTIDLVGFQIIDERETKTKGAFGLNEIKIISNPSTIAYQIKKIQDELKRMFFSLGFRFFVLNASNSLDQELQYLRAKLN